MMNAVTYGLPAAAGGSGPVVPAPREAQEQSNYRRALLHVEAQHATAVDDGAVVDLPAVAGALAALDAALAEHGAPDPERTAAWLESEAKPAGAVFAVVPRG